MLLVKHFSSNVKTLVNFGYICFCVTQASRRKIVQSDICILANDFVYLSKFRHPTILSYGSLAIVNSSVIHVKAI